MLAITPSPLSPLHSLLKAVSDTLAKPQTLPARLTIALKTIAQELGATTAIIYLLSPDRYLEVYAVHDSTTAQHKKIRFRIGEGVVGFIAGIGKSLICDNIARHPNFLFWPGIAEHLNLALLGVPLISPKGLIGVLTLQNPVSNPFDQWREKSLMEIGNYFANLPELQRFPVFNVGDGKVSGTQTLQGIPFNAGIATGTAFIHQPYGWKETDFTQNVKEESLRLKLAIREMIEAIDRLVESTPELGKGTQDILSSYRMIASDRGWVRKMQGYIQKGLTAEAAVQKVRRQTRERFAEIGDQILKGRLTDLEDLASRLLKQLSGKNSSTEELPESTILVAHNLGPAELLDYDRRFIKGLVLEEGVHTAHVAILARSLDIPVVGRIPLLLTHVEDGDKLIVNGTEGTVIVNPDPEAFQSAREKMRLHKQGQVLNKEMATRPCQTLDGTLISLSLNAGLPIDLHHLDELSFEGVGLYRTEISFMMRSSFPDVKTQTEIYKDIFEHAKGQPITFRTLDIGGDKIVPYMWRIQDENPVLGWRAIRVALDKPAILRQQVRALIHASPGQPLRLLFPMISDINEYRQARGHAEQEWRRAKEGGLPLPASLSYGVMLEVPSIVDQLETLLKEVDFVSVGTNDLFQFYFACDRTNPTISGRYDSLSSTFLNYLRKIWQTCEEEGVPISICGEMAGKPLEALALMGIGYRSFSVSGPSAGQLKKMILSTPLKETESFLRETLSTYSHSLRKPLADFAKNHKICLGSP
ncbi:phosphoenolpyruvate--protein phosphotransferase [Kamptonema cortianum]|jgi:phosphotransferase system enzyme I (PtsP)|nr:phosphoenolpyruvate--protein phosphotransferase [Kamptonema cortianum]